MKGQELKRRIQGVQETVKITKATQMIAASKMPKAQQIFESSRKYLKNVAGAVKLIMRSEHATHPYFKRTDNGRAAYIVIASDKGLCGDFNHVILDAAYKSMQTVNAVKVFAIGQVTKEYFKKKNITVSNAYIHFTQTTIPEDARAITNDLIERYNKGEIDEVYLAYAEVETLAKHKSTIKRILPVSYEENTDNVAVLTPYREIANMLNQYIWAEIYFAIASSVLAINYKRMVAMRQSTTSGEEMIEKLKLQYNHKRQEGITTELMDTAASLQGRRL